MYVMALVSIVDFKFYICWTVQQKLNCYTYVVSQVYFTSYEHLLGQSNIWKW